MSLWTRVGKRRRERAIINHWNRVSRIRRICIRSKCGLSEFGKWYYDCMYKDVPFPDRSKNLIIKSL